MQYRVHLPRCGADQSGSEEVAFCGDLNVGTLSLCLREASACQINCKCGRVLFDKPHLQPQFFRLRIPVLILKFYSTHAYVPVSPNQLWPVLSRSYRD